MFRFLCLGVNCLVLCNLRYKGSNVKGFEGVNLGVFFSLVISFCW